MNSTPMAMPMAHNALIRVSSCARQCSRTQPISSAAATAAGKAPCSGSSPKYTAAPMPPSTEWAMPPARKAMRLTTT
jgi:hypothetical protein